MVAEAGQEKESPASTQSNESVIADGTVFQLVTSNCQLDFTTDSNPAVKDVMRFYQPSHATWYQISLDYSGGMINIGGDLWFPSSLSKSETVLISMGASASVHLGSNSKMFWKTMTMNDGAKIKVGNGGNLVFTTAGYTVNGEVDVDDNGMVVV